MAERIVVNELGSRCAFPPCRERSTMLVRAKPLGVKLFVHAVCLEHGEFYLSVGFEADGATAQLEMALA